MKFDKYYLFLILLFVININAQQGDSLKIVYNYINTLPQNANVYLDNDFIGSTPVRFLNNIIDTARTHQVVIKAYGYFDFSFSFNNSELPLNRTIKLIPLSKSLSQKDIVLKDGSSTFKSNRKMFPIVLSGVITAGSAAFSFYFKSQANDLYDEYLFSGDRDKLDKTKKYDLYSGIALGVLQVSFVSLLYFLLIE